MDAEVAALGRTMSARSAAINHVEVAPDPVTSPTPGD